ncbi:ATP-binding protein [Marinospirillum sp.]|uniref:ATP-binding protein n=1 Tax=Marinospirillum sp. TaxID=2183934 RepID=UPI00384C9C7E
MESVAGFAWNGWQLSSGISGRLGLEYAILTTNKDFTDWGEFFHNDNVAIPIVDRIIHHSHIFMLGGESYRLKEKLTN